MPSHPDFLDDVLVITVKKTYWASPESRIFPHILYSKQLYGYSQNRLNAGVLGLRSLLYWFFRRPKLMVFGSAHRVARWFALLKKRGYLRHTRLVVTNQIYFDDDLAPCFDRIIVFSHSDIQGHDDSIKPLYTFFPVPENIPATIRRETPDKPYIFSGGGTKRDYASLIEAVRGLDIHLKIVTFSPQHLGYEGELPPNCEVLWTVPYDEFISLMANALLIVNPLQDHWHSHGQRVIVQTMLLGKALITTQQASVDEYVEDQKEALLVAPGDVAGYRAAIQKLLDNSDLRHQLEHNALERSMAFTDAAYTENLIALCKEVLNNSN